MELLQALALLALAFAASVSCYFSCFPHHFIVSCVCKLPFSLFPHLIGGFGVCCLFPQHHFTGGMNSDPLQTLISVTLSVCGEAVTENNTYVDLCKFILYQLKSLLGEMINDVQVCAVRKLPSSSASGDVHVRLEQV